MRRALLLGYLLLVGAILCSGVALAALCIGGPNAGNTCTAASECPSGACGATPTVTPTATFTAAGLQPTPTVTVTPVASQLLPCRIGGSISGGCGGQCPVGSQCVFVPANADCSCQVDALACRGGSTGTNGYCVMKPNEVGGNCTLHNGIFRCE